MKRSLITLAIGVLAAAAAAGPAQAACPTAYPNPVSDVAAAQVQGTLCDSTTTFGRSKLSYSVNYNGTVYNKNLSQNLTYRALRVENNNNTSSSVTDEFKGSTARPVILFVHGGGFTAGGRDDMIAYAKLFARRGWVSVMPDYQLVNAQDFSSNGNYGTTLTVDNVSQSAQRDIQTAVRNLRARAGVLGINTARIYVVGVSAGAITSVRLATRSQDAGTTTDQSFRNRKVDGTLAATGQDGQSSSVDGAVSVSGVECYPSFPTSVYITPYYFNSGSCTVDPLTTGDAPFKMLHGYQDNILHQDWATQACAAYGTQCTGTTLYYAYPQNETTGGTSHSDGSIGKCVITNWTAWAGDANKSPGGDHLMADPGSCPSRAGLTNDAYETSSLFTNTTNSKAPVAMQIYQSVKAWF